MPISALRIVGWLAGPVGRYLGAGALMLGLLGAIYARGWSDGREGCEARVEIAVGAERQRQASAAAAALDAARQRAEARDAEVAGLQNEVQSYAQELAKRSPDAACIGTDADLERMRRILR